MTHQEEAPHIPDWVPWEKALIWSLFFLFIYIASDFFFVIFMTFLLSYSMRGVVVYLAKKITPKVSTKISHPLFAVICFCLLIFSTYRLGAYIFPEFVSQAQSLAKKITNPKKSHKAQFDELMANSLGQYLFSQKYGEPGSQKYMAALNSSEQSDKSIEGFRELSEEIQEEFELSLLDNSEITNSTDKDKRIQEWATKVKAPALLNQNRQLYSNEWESYYRQQEFQIPGLAPLSSLDNSQREEAILRFISSNLLNDLDSRQNLEKEWAITMGKKHAFQLKKDAPAVYREKFKFFYNDLKETRGESLTYTFDQFEGLLNASLTSPTLFLDAFNKIKNDSPEGNSEEKRKADFEKEEKFKLISEWKKGDVAEKLESKFQESLVATMSLLGKEIGEAIPKIIVLPIQLALALILSFFIVIDIPRMKEGIERLKTSRVRNFYEEIAPGLISFGKLIGRSFQAQALIAIINTVLTLAAIKILGIQNAAFLSVVVFICSFIPVLGVVMSGIPICIMALIQDDGGLMLAFWAIIAILLVHFLETSVLNPKVVGEVMHLHPVLVLAVLAIGEHFFGIWGLLLGTPVVVYIIRFVILDEGIPGLIEPIRKV